MFTDFWRGKRRERGGGGGRERERERERETCERENIDWLPPVHALTGDWTHNLFGVQDDTTTNWATWPGQKWLVFSELQHHTNWLTKNSQVLFAKNILLNIWLRPEGQRCSFSHTTSGAVPSRVGQMAASRYLLTEQGKATQTNVALLCWAPCLRRDSSISTGISQDI